MAGNAVLRLHKLIFRADYERAFYLLDRRGEILQSVTERRRDIWNQFGFGQDGTQVSLKKQKENEEIVNLNIHIDNINAMIESQQAISDLDRFKYAFEAADEVLGKFQITKFTRLGARFYFLYEVASFEEAREKCENVIDKPLREVLPGNLTDLAIVADTESDGAGLKMRFGPIKRDEYCSQHWFSVGDNIDIDNAFLFDCDYFVRNYELKIPRLGRYVRRAHEDCCTAVNRVIKYLLS